MFVLLNQIDFDQPIDLFILDHTLMLIWLPVQLLFDKHKSIKIQKY